MSFSPPGQDTLVSEDKKLSHPNRSSDSLSNNTNLIVYEVYNFNPLEVIGGTNHTKDSLGQHV